ncbi:MAG: adenine deaminase [Bacteroidetes bacterium]|nr:adenine deaminase [Bacteroidota bacterium]
MTSFTISGNIVDIPNRIIRSGTIHISGSSIDKIAQTGEEDPTLPYVLPGFVDSHVHVESSMMVPSEFARLAVVHGMVATISDPHEIANVCGIEGVEFMIENGKQVPFKFYFGAPSCVPATLFETAGACIDAQQIDNLLARPEIKYLSEMMNFPGVLFHDPEVMQKITAAQRHGKPIDGHAPGLRGEAATKYIRGGQKEGPVVISTDHECFTAEEALDKLQHGMKILIREGSAAKNFEALIPLLHDYPDQIMFCSDDKHPDSLVENHLNIICKRAVTKGIDVFKVLQAACINPVQHYRLEVGLLRPADAADFILVKDLKNFEVLSTYINGKKVAENGQTLISSVPVTPINQFQCEPTNAKVLAFHEDELVKSEDGKTIPVIEALEGQLITNKLDIPLDQFAIEEGIVQSNTQKDWLYMVVVNRYHTAPIAKCFVKNFGLKQGAIASSVAHDSHNIIAVGVDLVSLERAINLIIEAKGGVSSVVPSALTDEWEEVIVPLPVAGLMSDRDGYEVAESYGAADRLAKKTGSPLAAPFMTLSFMALLVIPFLKLSDKGLTVCDEKGIRKL